jgi:hypothetical protein
MKIQETTPIDQSELPMVLNEDVLEDILGVNFVSVLLV